MSKLGRSHLVIGDAHVKPAQNLRRFNWLGLEIAEKQPEVIVIIGDWADMPSLCSYDKGKRSFEGRRYAQDIESANLALDITFHHIDKLNKRLRACKRKLYKPEIHITLGNHENRINRATEDDPALDGILSTDHLLFDDYNIKVHPFLDEVEIDGVSYSHYFVSGVMARPIGGEHPATMLLNKQHRSCTAGHSHLADWSQRRQAGGQHIMGCVLGCYFEHDETYVPPSVSSMWWRGLVYKTNVFKGCYDPHFISMNTLKHKYLKKNEKWSVK